MAHSYIIGEDYITLVNVKTGNSVTMYSDNCKYEEFKSLIIQREFDRAENVGDVKKVVADFAYTSENFGFSIAIHDGILQYKTSSGECSEINTAIVPRIIKMAQDGFDCKPLYRFVEKLLQNPSKQSVDELYMFLELNNLPITEDGCFVAYKIVKEDYFDIYTGKMRNQIGDRPFMSRNQVDDRRENTCSQGLHFCSKEYLSAYGSSNRDTDRCILVKINPADVVSIPSDYNNAKGRCTGYTVVSEVDGDWRKKLGIQDFTEAAVVSATASPYSFRDEFDPVAVFDEYFWADSFDGVIRWNDTDNLASDQHVINKLVRLAGVSTAEAEQFVDNIRMSLDDQPAGFGTTCLLQKINEAGYYWAGTHWADEQDRLATRYDIMIDTDCAMFQILDLEEEMS